MSGGGIRFEKFLDKPVPLLGSVGLPIDGYGNPIGPPSGAWYAGADAMGRIASPVVERIYRANDRDRLVRQLRGWSAMSAALGAEDSWMTWRAIVADYRARMLGQIERDLCTIVAGGFP